MPLDFDQRVLDFAAGVKASGPVARLASPISQPCTMEQITEPVFDKWVHRLGAGGGPNRKVWEWAYICEVLEQQAIRLNRPMNMLGFGVGREPIVGWFASQGHNITATDLPATASETDFWDSSDQHAANADMLDMFNLCPRDELERRVTFTPVDMRSVPLRLRGFDAVWSSCAFEHLGSLDAGLQFVRESLSCLAPDGVGVHTTEFNVSSTTDTIDLGPVVLYRQSDLEEFSVKARRAGYANTTTYNLGDDPDNALVDRPPYSVQHLRVLSGGYVTTSFGFTFQNENTASRQRTELTRRTISQSISRIRAFAGQGRRGIRRRLART
ncbi:MAG: hypothetical protein ACI91O_000019 [Candidatus Poriferisodalaceae bacterium]|jgi:hypothetical protein